METGKLKNKDYQESIMTIIPSCAHTSHVYKIFQQEFPIQIITSVNFVYT